MIVKFSAASPRIIGNHLIAQAQYFGALLGREFLNIRYEPVAFPFPTHKSMAGEDRPWHALGDFNVIFDLALIMRQEGRGNCPQ